ncbi:MAG TPA: hypothetical protein PK480_01535 [Candidatus Hydrogenedentes bacterium]|nr:hypothetical protein [Candidatus Hydrogenedentota bacterium]
MSLKKFCFLSVLMTASFPGMVFPCAWEPMSSYFGEGSDKDLYYLPDTHFDSEYLRITDQLLDLTVEEAYRGAQLSFYMDLPNYLTRMAVAQQRAETSEAEALADALAENESKESFLEAYRFLRDLVNRYAHRQLDLRIHGEQGWTFQEEEHPEMLEQRQLQALLDVCPDEIPPQFRLYLQGAGAFHSGDYRRAQSSFSQILQLPEAERTHKTVWALFMLGRCAMELKALDEAESFFHQTQHAVDDGFADPLNLHGECFGWFGKIYLERGAFVEAVHAYVEYRYQPEKWEMGKESLFILFQRIFSQETDLRALAQDDLSRQLITAWFTSQSRPNPDRVKRWLESVALLPRQEELPGAGQLAWLAYHHGDMEAAARWQKQSDEHSLAGRFVYAKLLLREGKLEEADALLKALVEDTNRDRLLLFEGHYPRVTGASVRAAEAAVLLKQDDYIGALKNFAPVFLEDAQFLARRILTLDELDRAMADLKSMDPQEVADTLDTGDYFNETEYQEALSGFLCALETVHAQRLARLNDWSDAAQHFQQAEALLKEEGDPEDAEDLSAAAQQIADLMRRTKESALSDREKAQLLMDAGALIRQYGSDLLGEWWLFQEPGAESLTEGGRDLLSDDGLKRMDASRNVCGRQYSFRFIASDLMKEAAELLPDNDPLTAKALFLGGTYLKARYPKEADFFYKALIRRNPNLKIAKQADELKWFPENFTDEILYTPRPPEGLRKRDVAILVAKGALIVLAVGLLLWGLKRRCD